MKRNKIAMLLAMALTVTQSVAVPVAAEELTADAGQEVEMAQDDADAEVAVEADEDASEEAEAEIQEDAEELQDEDFAAEEDLSDGTARRPSVMMLVGQEKKGMSLTGIMMIPQVIPVYASKQYHEHFNRLYCVDGDDDEHFRATV